METEWVIARVNLYQLWRKHPEWPAHHLATEVGRSERWVKKWRQRFQAVSVPNAGMFRSQSRAPKQSPKQVHREVIEKILQLRISLPEEYHRTAGGKLILSHLHHDELLKARGHWLPRSKATIYRILKAAGCLAKRIFVREPRSLKKPRTSFGFPYTASR
jgi:hypothetical protein